MTILSQEDKAALSAEFTALLEEYGLTYGYLVGCTEDGYAAVIEGHNKSQQTHAMANVTKQAMQEFGAVKAPIISTINPKTMKKATRNKLITAVESILQLKEHMAAHQIQTDALKVVVTDICNAHPEALTEGVLTLKGVGVIKMALNKPKLIFLTSGETLTDDDKLNLINKIGPSYQKLDIDVAKLRDAITNGDKTVVKAAEKMAITVAQESRYDVKKAGLDMASISDLFIQAKAMHDERVAWLLHQPPDYKVMKEVEELKKIGHLLVNAYRQAGGTKVEEHEHVPGQSLHNMTDTMSEDVLSDLFYVELIRAKPAVEVVEQN